MLVATINARLARAAPDEIVDFAEPELTAALLTARERPDVTLVHDRKVDPGAMDALLSALSPTTPGARAQALASASLFEALSHVLTDKLFKESLRSRAASEDQAKAANGAISGARAIDQTVRDAVARLQPKRQASISELRLRRAPAVATAATPLAANGPAPSPAAPVHVAKPAALLPFLDRRFGFRVGRHRQPETASVSDLLGTLAVGCEPTRMRAMLLGLSLSDDRLVLLVIGRLDEEHALTVATAIRPILRLAVTRLAAQFNAHDRAYASGTALAADAAAMAALEESDRVALAFQIGRAALRSGRTAEAAERFRALFLAHPERGDAIMNYVSATYVPEPQLALDLARAALINGVHLAQTDLIFLADIFINADRLTDATAMLLSAAKTEPGYAEAIIGFANLACARGDRAGWLAALRQYGERAGFPITGEIEPGAPLPFALKTDLPPLADHPPVAVVMTSYNAAATIRRAAASVLAQTAADLELWIVDDGSDDGTRAIIEDMAATDPRVRPLFNDANSGTYVSKNRAVAMTDLPFVTFHDSDDWMHPQRLERQLAAMDEQTVCVTANWLRMRADGRIIVRRGYTHLNPASTFVRREVFERLGGFDRVRTGADAEFLARVRARYGWSRVKVLPDCLGIGLHHDGSLTQTGVAAFDEHRYSPVRLAYTEAWLGWHVDEMASGGPLSIAGDRRFAAPPAIQVD